jgi:phage-related protein
MGTHKGVVWMGDSLKRLREFPEDVQQEIGYVLYLAQLGENHASAGPMKGYNAVEIVSDYAGNAFRGVYTTKFEDVIYVLHCFQKKSKKGIKTPKRELDLIKSRLRDAEKLHKA